MSTMTDIVSLQKGMQELAVQREMSQMTVESVKGARSTNQEAQLRRIDSYIGQMEAERDSLKDPNMWDKEEKEFLKELKAKRKKLRRTLLLGE